jgi:hypothetical protein
MEKINLKYTEQKSNTYETFKMMSGGTDNNTCLYRSIINQEQKGLDINFGFVLVKSKYNQNPLIQNVMGWCCPYDYHTWNEDDDNIYDSRVAWKQHGFNLPENPNVVIIDWNNKNIKTYSQYQKAVRNLIKMMRNSKVDMIYVCGVADNMTLDKVIGWEEMDYIINEGCNNIQYLTGATMNNVIEVVK